MRPIQFPFPLSPPSLPSLPLVLALWPVGLAGQKYYKYLFCHHLLTFTGYLCPPRELPPPPPNFCSILPFPSPLPLTLHTQEPAPRRFRNPRLRSWCWCCMAYASQFYGMEWFPGVCSREVTTAEVAYGDGGVGCVVLFFPFFFYVLSSHFDSGGGGRL